MKKIMKTFSLSFLLLSQFAMSAENSEYPLTKVTNVEPIYKYIGKLRSLAATCTATLISEKLALTAAHCVADFSPRKEIEKIEGNEWMYCSRASCPTVVLPYFDGTKKDMYNSKSFYIEKVIKGGLNFRIGSLEAGYENDWAILVLEKNSEKMPTNYPKVKNIAFNEMGEITIKGYPDHDVHNLHTTTCHPHALSTESLLEYPCSTTGGVSGAPIFISNGSEHTIVGIHSRGGSKLLNAGVHASEKMVNRIKAISAKTK